MELGMDGGSMVKLLQFLQYSFGGGTDVDMPFSLALDRLQQGRWSQVRVRGIWVPDPRILKHIL